MIVVVRGRVMDHGIVRSSPVSNLPGGRGSRHLVKSFCVFFFDRRAYLGRLYAIDFA